MFTVKLGEGMKAESFQKDAKFFIDPAKLLPLSRFLPQPKGAKRTGTAVVILLDARRPLSATVIDHSSVCSISLSFFTPHRH